VAQNRCGVRGLPSQLLRSVVDGFCYLDAFQLLVLALSALLICDPFLDKNCPKQNPLPQGKGLVGVERIVAKAR